MPIKQWNETFDWQQCPDASRVIWSRVREIEGMIPFAAELASRMLKETGTRFVDWVDHLVLSPEDPLVGDLLRIGYELDESAAAQRVYRHADALLPAIRIVDASTSGMFLRVESVADFAAAHRLNQEITGDAATPLRAMLVAQNEYAQLGVMERHGETGFVPMQVSERKIVQSLAHAEAFQRRRRDFDQDELGFEHASELARAAITDLGVDWACDLFFAAERRYWESRNHAARLQKRRQDRLGLGWGNHDHHTYRSSREHFLRLVDFLELLGFECRERFYGGAEAGWGAQVLEQTRAGIVIFADVDLSATEVAGDFAHEGLQQRSDLGTVGLWCMLHGDAFLQAGMHHLECQFDFQAARSQLADVGIESMKPFTEFDYLKQSFTAGEKWQVDPRRIESALRNGLISEDQASRFQSEGSVGSHLEILQRDDGYKGFNQTGISEIIRATDPRRIASHSSED